MKNNSQEGNYFVSVLPASGYHHRLAAHCSLSEKCALLRVILKEKIICINRVFLSELSSLDRRICHFYGQRNTTLNAAIGYYLQHMLSPALF